MPASFEAAVSSDIGISPSSAVVQHGKVECIMSRGSEHCQGGRRMPGLLSETPSRDTEVRAGTLVTRSRA